MAHTAARRDAGAEGAQGDASPPLTPVARALGFGVEARPAQPLLRDHSLLHRGRADALSSDGDDDAASFGAAGWGDSEGDGDVTAAEQDFGQALLASSVERDFGIMVLVGLTTRCSKPLLSLLLAYCLLVFGATLVTAAPNRPTTDQLRVTALHTLNSPSQSDRIMPPALLFITLHGDRMPTSSPGGGASSSSTTVVTSVGNALARFRITGLHSLDGSQPLRLEQLPSVALYPLADGSNGRSSGASSLLMPRGMAVLSDSSLLVASAADDAPGRPKGAILAVSALNACAASDEVAWHAPPAEAKGGKRKGSAPAQVVSVPARVLWYNGAHHPYGVATGGMNSNRMFVSNQGNGRSYVIDTDSGIPILELPRHCVSQQPASAASDGGSSSTTGLRGIATNGDGSRVYIACKDDNAVYVHDAATGAQLDAIPVEQPIAVLWGDLGGLAGQGVEGLFIGSDSATSDKAGEVRVFFWDASQGRIAMQYRVADGGGHAAGLARVGGALLVLGQDAGALHQFDSSTGRFVGTLVTGLKRPEALQVWTGACQS